MALNFFNEIGETIIKKFSESNLGKISDVIKSDIGILDYDKPLGVIKSQNENIIIEKKEDTTENRPLTDEEKEYYKKKLGCSDSTLDKLTIDENGKLTLKTINEGKEGSEGENGVRYEKKIIIINGVEIEGVFPVFDSKFDTYLSEDMLDSSDTKQEKECNEKLKEELEKNPEMANQFTDEQLEQIKNGDTPDGYTWHHNEEQGKMQLIKTEDHQANRHTGGKAIWGGGSDNR